MNERSYRTIAALFVVTGGNYFNIPHVDPYDVHRDARTYEGPYSVVAHPPCQLWVNFAALNYKRYGGEHNLPGNDRGAFSSALVSVRTYGGVMEHPAFTNAWDAHSLPRPTGKRGEPIIGWICTGRTFNRMDEYVCEVWQSAYGHRARKRTWLYYVGSSPPHNLRWQREPGDAQVGWFDRIKPTLSKKEASATPVEFRDELIRLAMSARDGD